MNKTRKRTADGSIATLKNMIHQIEPLFTFDAGETFTHRDLDGNHQQLLNSCTDHGALHVIGTERYQREDMTKKRKLNKYQWDPRIRQKLLEYRERMNKLPCGHRAHLWNSREVPEGKLSCKVCAENGDYPEFDKEVVREVI